MTDSAGLGALYHEQFEVGRRDIIDLLNIQRERFDAERQLDELKIQSIRIQYRAAARLGLLSALLEGRLPTHEG